jgi:phosphate butyryltransferase
MIRTLNDVNRLAKEKGPKKLAVLAPEDDEFMLAVKQSWQNGYIEPVLIGNREKMERVADEVEFDISNVEKIFEVNRQAIANLGTSMLFAGEVDMESKGQIPTSYIYRSIIKEESKVGTGKTISVISFWEIPELNRLIAFTDTGVNINPDWNAKAEVIKNAVFLFHLLGYPRPRVSILSGQRKIGGSVDSYRDAELLKKAADSGDLGECEITPATSFSDIFLGQKGRLARYEDIDITSLPEILLVPNLDTGNILVKLDFFLDVTRRSVIVSSKGPVIVPSRSDFSDSIMGEIAMGVVVADRIKGVV